MRGALQAQLRKLYPGCAGKTRWPDKKSANKDLDRIMAENKAEGHEEKSLGLNVYQCRTCLQWHVGRDVAKPGSVV